MSKITLKTPFSEHDVAKLKVGDIISIDGTIWTARSRVHKRIAEEGPPPIDLKEYNVMLHSGPIMQKINGKWSTRVISITYSMRFDRWAPTVVQRTGVKAVIGKGGMGINTLNTMAKTGCIHLAKVGSFSGPLASKVKAVKEVHWLDLGIPEAVWLLDVEDFGPFVVAADLQGNSLFDTVEAEVEKRKQKVYEMLGIAGFQYAPRGTA